jgi:hypothetical protein
MRGSVCAPLHTGGFASHRRHGNVEEDSPSSPFESSKAISVRDFCKFTWLIVAFATPLKMNRYEADTGSRWT